MKAQAGMTLVEIVVAATILVTFLLPVFGLFLYNSRSTEFTSSWSVGLDLAANVMERLLSEDVPFLAIEPEGFGGGSRALSGRTQMDFRGGFGTMDFSGYKLQSILGGDSAGGYRLGAKGNRIIVKHGIEYDILVWAGIYKDAPSSPDSSQPGFSYKHMANPRTEQTFSYYPNPWFDPSNDCADDNASGASLSADLTDLNAGSDCAGNKGRPVNPYSQKAGFAADLNAPHFNTVSDPLDDRFRHGYPIPDPSASWTESSGFNTWQREQEASDNPAMLPSNQPYSVHYEDKAFHNHEDLNGDGEDDGGFMKVIVGVRWSPRGTGGAGSARRAQEYYLVSFKANLQTEID